VILVTVPYYQTPWLIRRAVDSILGQTYRDLQLVVVNDGDRGGPWKWLHDITDRRLIRFDLEKNRGRYYADSVALAACPHEYFTIHDSDDWSESTRIQTLLERIGGTDVVVDGYTRHGLNVQTEKYKPRPELIGHRSTKSLWHIAHHKALWRTDALKTLGLGPQFRVGWDTYLMHFAAQTLKVEWVNYYGYHQERRKGSLTQAAATGIQSKTRAAAIATMDGLWKQAQADPDQIPDLLKPNPQLEVEVQADAERLRSLL
jgi:glycosyltransferase involved in cell wall biosynthesis